MEVGDNWKVYGRATSAVSFDAEKVKRRDVSRRKKNKIEGRIEGGITRVGGELRFRLAGRAIRVDRKAKFTLDGEEKEIAAALTDDPWHDARQQGLPLAEELYDLAADPGERNDLSGAHRERLEEMRSRLSRLRTFRTGVRTPTSELGDEDVEAMRGLGYIEGGKSRSKKQPHGN